MQTYLTKPLLRNGINIDTDQLIKVPFISFSQKYVVGLLQSITVAAVITVNKWTELPEQTVQTLIRLLLKLSHQGLHCLPIFLWTIPFNSYNSTGPNSKGPIALTAWQILAWDIAARFSLQFDLIVSDCDWPALKN